MMCKAAVILCAALGCAALAACEAEVDLSGVEQTATKTTMRFDRFLAAARSDERVVVVGTRGVIVDSIDEGRTWRRHEIRPSNPAADNPAADPYARPHFVDVAVCPNGSFAALTMERTVWLGEGDPENWVETPLPTGETPLAIVCDQGGELWITATFSTLLRSIDGGQAWQKTEFGDDAQLTSIQIPDKSRRLVLGEFGLLLTSEDGGDSWQRQPPIGNDEFYPQTAFFETAHTGWVGGLKGTILFTENGGQSWVQQETGIDSPIYNFARAGGVLFAVGDHATVLKYQGDRWEKVPMAGTTAGYLRALTPLADDRLLVAGGMGKLQILDWRADSMTQIR